MHQVIKGKPQIKRLELPLSKIEDRDRFEYQGQQLSQ